MWDNTTGYCSKERSAHRFIIFLLILLLLLLALEGLFAQGWRQGPENRVALVIGNAAYLTGPLHNTVNDARAMALALESSGFEVMLRENVKNQNEMKRVVKEFGMNLKTGGTALFYYSGHGMQVQGYNYLIPTQAVVNIEQEVEYEALDVGFVLAYMESAKSAVNIVILDACRNNPFARTFRDGKQGLSSMVAPAGTLIAYSTAPGSIASDGEEEFGLYTRSLLEQMQQPGLKVEDVFKNVRAEVLEHSRGKQIPWESSSLVGDFYFHTLRHNRPQPPAQNGFQLASLNQSVIPQDAIKSSGTRLPFKWRATPEGEYYLMVDDREISAETVYELRGENLYVYHRPTNRVFVLKYFVYRLDGTWRRGLFYE